MTVLHAVAFVLTGMAGTAVVFIRDPYRQTFGLSLYGTMVAILFVLLAAPDVALSVMVVGAVVPWMILMALRIVERRSS